MREGVVRCWPQFWWKSMKKCDCESAHRRINTLIGANQLSPRTGLLRRKLFVCLSVCPSVCQTRALWQNRRMICSDVFLPYEKSFSLVFWEEWLVAATPSTWNSRSTGPRGSESADSEPIFARSASAVTSNESVQLTFNTNRKFTKRFPMSL